MHHNTAKVQRKFALKKENNIYLEYFIVVAMASIKNKHCDSAKGFAIFRVHIDFHCLYTFRKCLLNNTQ